MEIKNILEKQKVVIKFVIFVKGNNRKFKEGIGVNMGYHTSYSNEKCKGYCDIIVKNKRRFLFCSIVDSHLHVELFGAIKLDLKLKSKYPYKNAKIYGLSNKNQKPALIVSLTSYPERINTVSQAINTLLQQTLKPDKLILWLANEQFPNKELDLPTDLLKLKEFGLEINWCEDLKSYKKLIPSLHLFPDDIIVTADDDLYYQPDWLESLYKSYLKNPDCIHTRRAHHINLCGNILYILSHSTNNHFESSYKTQLMGGSGTLYPPHSLNADINNIDQIKNLIPTHDDIYFWAMAVLNDTKIKLVKSKNRNLITIPNTQQNGLCKINKSNSIGMSPKEAYKIILKKYPNICDKLRSY